MIWLIKQARGALATTHLRYQSHDGATFCKHLCARRLRCSPSIVWTTLERAQVFECYKLRDGQSTRFKVSNLPPDNSQLWR